MYLADLLGDRSKALVEEIVLTVRVDSNEPIRIGFDQRRAKAIKYRTTSLLQVCCVSCSCRAISGSTGEGGRMRVRHGLDNWVMVLPLIRLTLPLLLGVGFYKDFALYIPYGFPGTPCSSRRIECCFLKVSLIRVLGVNFPPVRG